MRLADKETKRQDIVKPVKIATPRSNQMGFQDRESEAIVGLINGRGSSWDSYVWKENAPVIRRLTIWLWTKMLRGGEREGGIMVSGHGQRRTKIPGLSRPAGQILGIDSVLGNDSTVGLAAGKNPESASKARVHFSKDTLGVSQGRENSMRD